MLWGSQLYKTIKLPKKFCFLKQFTMQKKPFAEAQDFYFKYIMPLCEQHKNQPASFDLDARYVIDKLTEAEGCTINHSIHNEVMNNQDDRAWTFIFSDGHRVHIRVNGYGEIYTRLWNENNFINEKLFCPMNRESNDSEETTHEESIDENNQITFPLRRAYLRLVDLFKGKTYLAKKEAIDTWLDLTDKILDSKSEIIDYEGELSFHHEINDETLTMKIIPLKRFYGYIINLELKAEKYYGVENTRFDFQEHID